MRGFDVAGLIERTPRPEGFFKLDVFQNGELVEHYEGENLVTNSGRSALCYAACFSSSSGAGDSTAFIGRIGFGSSVVPSNVYINALTPPLYLNALTQATFDNAYLNATFGFALVAGEAVGLSIGEFGLYTKRGALFARKNRSIPLVTDANTSLSGTWTISF
ncbi:MAG: hypothetical protein ACRYHQ_24245 [Janthinobacterium lividum]